MVAQNRLKKDKFLYTSGDRDYIQSWMNIAEDFTIHCLKFASPTRRAYVRAMRKALESVEKKPGEYESYEALLSVLRTARQEKTLPMGLRIAPFLRFLEAKQGDPGKEGRRSLAELEALRGWVIDRIEEETKVGNPSIYLRRDLGMLAGLCVAPERGSPRKWPKSALTPVNGVQAVTVRLWGKIVEQESLALPLLYWHAWRERLDRPEQSRLYRKSWAFSEYLFPNSKGEPLKKQALHNALARLSVPGEERVRLTPEEIREAFLIVGQIV